VRRGKPDFVTTADVHDSKAAPALLETFMDQPGRL
jgi:hypothetical protein